MFNAFPLNSRPLNSTWKRPGSSGDPVVILPPEPIGPGAIPPGYGYRWEVFVTVGGVQVSGLLCQRMEIDREEGAAAVATFSLYYPVGADVPQDFDGQVVTIDFSSETGGVTRQERRFTGYAIEPSWDVSNRLMNFTCSDQLQYRVENMTVAEVDALTGGWWTPDMFDSPDARSRWDYALERLESRPASLDASPTGALRVTSWYATAPIARFGPGSTIYQSVSADLAKTQQSTNRVELEISYRYSRLWQRDESYSWVHPGAQGHEGVQGFCQWRPKSSDLPDVQMIEQATEGAGLKLLANASYYRLPPSSGDPCGNGQAWRNDYPDLLLGASWTGSRRWTQSVTETYSLVVACPKGLGPSGGQVVSRQSTGFEVENPQADEWESGTITGPVEGVVDLKDNARRDTVLQCAIRRAVATVVGGQRGTSINWQVPTSAALGFDLIHTLALEDQTEGTGKVRRVRDEFDFDAGSAVTTLSIALMRGGGESDLLVLPPKPAVDAPPSHVGHPSLATQLGLRNESPIYDDDLDGFAGNYDNRDDDINPDLEEFPRRMSITASEIPAELRDERKVAVSGLYKVGIPDDHLVL